MGPEAITFAVFLLIAVCSGYFFVTTFMPTKYGSAREDGRRLYFKAVLYAFWLVVGTWLFLYYRFDQIQKYLVLLPEPIWRVATDFPLIEIAIMCSPITAGVLSYMLNLPFRFSILGYWLIARVVKTRDFENLVLHAASTRQPLLVVLDTNEVYVGWIIQAIDPTEPREYLKLMFTKRGYKMPDSNKVVFTSDRFEGVVRRLLGELKPSGLETVLPSLKSMWQDRRIKWADCVTVSKGLMTMLRSRKTRLRAYRAALNDLQVVLPITRIVSARIFHGDEEDESLEFVHDTAP